jgi:uncharacterized protein (DUF433 family)
MAQPLTIQLEETAADALSEIARTEHRSVGEIGARFIDEGLRQNHFPQLEFRSFNGERHACIKGALQVWQLVMVAKDFEMDVVATSRHLDLTPEQVSAAIRYYETYPDEIDLALKENDLGFERLKAILPDLRSTPSLDKSASESRA